MKALDYELTKFLSTEAQFSVPIYQRKYSWKKENCLKLLDDIIKVTNDDGRPCHFIGSVLYLAKDSSMHASAVKEYLVIDGQQRLTTISILLLALGDYTALKFKNNLEEYKKAATNLDKISRKYLLNEDESGDLYYKVKLNKEDSYAWKKLINNREKPDDIDKSKIFDNYKVILEEFCKQNVDPQVIYNGIKKLRLVDICILPEDNAQLVFETVNSTGLPLSVADKIRNFLLMTVNSDKQESLYNNYWHPMEIELDMQFGDRTQFEKFINYYMTSVLQKTLTGDYYDIFKNYYYKYKSEKITTLNSSSSVIVTEELVKEIYKYSKYYKVWLDASETGDKIQRALYDVRRTGQLKITSVILKLLADRDNNLITDEDLLVILRIIESYWMRRTICALPTNTAGPVCISMLKSLYETNKVESFKKNLEELTWPQRVPDNREIKETLKTLKIYSLNSTRTKMLLDKIENSIGKEHVNTNEYTIEHIMPQNLSKAWKQNLGSEYKQVHEKYLHTIGNLTLTGYNSEYQNKCFVDKLDCKDKQGNNIGYRHTPIKISHSLIKYNQWGEKEILARTNQLVNKLIEIWEYPISKDE